MALKRKIFTDFGFESVKKVKITTKSRPFASESNGTLDDNESMLFADEWTDKDRYETLTSVLKSNLQQFHQYVTQEINQKIDWDEFFNWVKNNKTKVNNFSSHFIQSHVFTKAENSA